MNEYFWGVFEVFTSFLEAFIYVRFMKKIFDQNITSCKQILAYTLFAFTITMSDYLGIHLVFKLLVMLSISFLISKTLFKISVSNIIAYTIIWNVFAMACDTLILSFLLQAYSSLTLEMLYERNELRFQAVLFSRLVFYILLEIFIKLSMAAKYKYRSRELCYMIIQTITCMIYLMIIMELAIS